MTQKFVPKGQSEAPTIKLPEPLEKLFAFFPASLRGKKYSYLLSFHVEGKKDKINDKFQEIINKSTYFPMADEDWQIMQGFIDKANLLGYSLYLPLDLLELSLLKRTSLWSKNLSKMRLNLITLTS